MVMMKESMLCADQLAQYDIAVMFGDSVIVGDLLDHVDVVFLVVFPEFGLQNHEEIVALFSL